VNDNAPPSTLRVCGIAGSLRRDSFNRQLLRAARELAPPGMEIVPFDLAGVPLYNGDVEAAGDPEAVTALKGATPGMGGTGRAQMSLRQSFVFTQTLVLVGPEVLVARAREKFDASRQLADEATRGFVRRLLEALVDWTMRLRGR
jgi:chromate reductase